MNYQPRHAQPFSYAQALQLEIPVITEEIARLKISLEHLNRTRRELSDYLAAPSEDDRELVDALRENDVVIASQTERISMLKGVLEEKGLNTSVGHYGLSGVLDDTEDTAPRQVGSHSRTLQLPTADHDESGDGGVYL